MVGLFLLERHLDALVGERWPHSCPPEIAGQEALKFLLASVRDGIEEAAALRVGIEQSSMDRATQAATQVPERGPGAAVE